MERSAVKNTFPKRPILGSACAILLLASLSFCGCRWMKAADRAKDEVAALATGQEAEFCVPGHLKGAPLSELVDFALETRPEVASAILSVEDARLALLQIAADAPLFGRNGLSANSLEVGLSVSRNASSAAADSVGDLKWRTHGSASAALSLDLLLWDAGRNDARASAQVERVIAAEMQLLSTRYSVFLDVSGAYFDLLEKRALLCVSLTNETVHAVHLEQAERRLEAGEANKLDVLRARLDAAKAREGVVNAKNAVLTCEAKMLFSLGLDSSRCSCDDVIGAGTNALDFVTMGISPSTEGMDEMFAFARTNSPALALSRARLRAAMADVDFAKADLLPSVSASASLNWTDPKWLWKWGLSGVWSLFEGFGKTRALERAVTAMRSAAADTERAEQSLSSDLEIALCTRDNATEAMKSAGDSYERAKENMRQVSEMFAIGEANRVDFTTAAADCAEALGSRISAFYAGQRAEAAISAIVGEMPRFEAKTLKEDEL